jgi:hypothetical protein
LTVSCQIAIDYVRFKRQEPYEFAACPRIGDTVTLASQEDKPEIASFTVFKVVHVPQGGDPAEFAHTIVHVR